MGLNGVFMYDAAGATATTAHDNIDNVVLTVAISNVQVMKRGKAWTSTAAVQNDAELTFDIPDREGDALIAAIAAAIATTAKKMAFYPRDKTGGVGLDADWVITGFDRNESNDGIITYSVTAKPNDDTRDPSWG
jgi:hypothetical protein